DIDDLGRIEKGGNETVLRRCRHVISENARVLAAVESLDKGELERFGELMNESHLSLARDYEVSCPELNLLVSLTQKHEGVVGARMTGAGFGGATVAIMKSDAVEPFKEKVVAQYENESGKQASVHVCQSVDGAAVLKRPR
ncbi:MAG TPA: hypothetical protein V6C72_03510, partial [Chroococcales cyanobacterium]